MDCVVGLEFVRMLCGVLWLWCLVGSMVVSGESVRIVNGVSGGGGVECVNLRVECELVEFEYVNGDVSGR